VQAILLLFATREEHLIAVVFETLVFIISRRIAIDGSVGHRAGIQHKTSSLLIGPITFGDTGRSSTLACISSIRNHRHVDHR
jgi:hypothetical protein